MKIRVLIADDHKIVRQGLRGLIDKRSDVVVIGEAENGRTAVRLTKDKIPDVVVMDVAMPDMNGIEATRRITELATGVKIIGLSMYRDRRFIVGMLSSYFLVRTVCGN